MGSRCVTLDSCVFCITGLLDQAPSPFFLCPVYFLLPKTFLGPSKATCVIAWRMPLCWVHGSHHFHPPCVVSYWKTHRRHSSSLLLVLPWAGGGFLPCLPPGAAPGGISLSPPAPGLGEEEGLASVESLPQPLLGFF